MTQLKDLFLFSSFYVFLCILYSPGPPSEPTKAPIYTRTTVNPSPQPGLYNAPAYTSPINRPPPIAPGHGPLAQGFVGRRNPAEGMENVGVMNSATQRLLEDSTTLPILPPSPPQHPPPPYTLIDTASADVAPRSNQAASNVL